MLSTGDFYGLPTRVLQNQHLRLEFLAEAGPRIVRLSLADSDDNLLAELPDFKVPTVYGDYHFRGGHRLWHAPEASPRTYVLDDQGVTVDETPHGVRLTGPVEAITGLRKSIEIRLHPDRSALTLTHQLHSTNVWPIELAPWAITQLRLGGIAVLPQPSAVDADNLLPNRRFALWPYASWQDARLDLRDDFILFHARPSLPPFKIGYRNTHGWLGYWREGIFFCKRFDVPTDSAYPDFGCNAELYCNDMFVELETLGPLQPLQPGATVTHTETWDIQRGLDLPDLPDAIRTVLAAHS